MAGPGSKVTHVHFGKGIIVDANSEPLTVWFKSQQGTRQVMRSFNELQITDAVAATEATGASISIADIEEALDNVLERRLHEMQLVPMGTRWNSSTITLKPGDDSLQAKEIPIETFFHKIVMVRDRLRLIEQKINAHKVLTSEEKVDLQQYVTGVYGSLTTFNVLFRDSHHQFKGSSKE
jgi:hypothetical protein